MSGSVLYGPSNAVIALSGDVKPEDARQGGRKYFGAFNPGTPVAHPSMDPAKRTGNQREKSRDRVPSARI